MSPWLAMLCVVALTSCGSELRDAPTSRSLTDSGTTDPLALDDLDAALDQPSVLSLFQRLEPGERGSFTASSPAAVTEERSLLGPVRGRFWVTPSGNVYTALDLDLDFTNDQLDRFLAAERHDSLDGFARDALGEALAYRGDEYQLGLAEFVLRAGAGGGAAGLAVDLSGRQLFRIFTTTPEACMAALDEVESAAKAFVEELDIEWHQDGPVERFTFPSAELAASVRDESDATRAGCPTDDGDDEDEFDDAAGAVPVVFERGATDQGRTLRALVGDDPTPLLEIELTREGEGVVPDPPTDPEPYGAFEFGSFFIAKIDECDAIPWEFSDFAASYTYSPPDSHSGPMMFATTFVCEDQVDRDRISPLAED